MKKLKLMIALLLLSATTVNAQLPTEPLCVDLIPLPAKMQVYEGYFMFSKETPIVLDKRFKAQSGYILEMLKDLTDLDMSISKEKDADSSIKFIYDDGIENEEAYLLDVNNESITIKAKGTGGVIYGLQTLSQLIKLNNPSWNHRYIFVPALKIDDEPRFEWRGFMLDVSRSFFSISQLKQYVDHLASLKLNRFHLHLSDDQGIRVEIKSFPKLNTIGSWRADRVVYDERDNSAWGRKVQQDGELANYGGYYTREQIAELVAYAKMRNVEIVPEIDIPGHSQAIVAAYPELSCEPHRDYKVATGAVRENNTLCPSNEKTYEVIEGIITEVAEMFPFEYIHMGGDECSKNQWKVHDQCIAFKEEHGLEDDKKLHGYFVNRVEKIVNSKGKKIIGWDEIIHTGVNTSATVMSWGNAQKGIDAAKLGHKVVMSPFHSNYLDLKQGQSYFEPNMGYSEALMAKTYDFNIIPDELTEEEGKLIIGNQANLWTETFAGFKMIQYMTFPRLYALAENSWTPNNLKDWDQFINRLKPHMKWMDNNGVRFARSVFNPWMHHVGNGKEIKVWFTSQVTNPEIRYTIDGTEPISDSPIYSDTITIKESCVLRAAIFEDGEILGDVIAREFPIHKAINATVKIYNENSPTGWPIYPSKLNDLTYGEYMQARDTTWTTLEHDADIEVFFDEPTDMESVSITTVRTTSGRIYPAKQIIIWAKCSGGEYKEIADTGVMDQAIVIGRNLITNKVPAVATSVESIKIKITKEDAVHEGYVPQIVGKPTLMQLDEIVVK